MTAREFLTAAADAIFDSCPEEQKDRETALFEARILLFHFSDITAETLPFCSKKELPEETEQKLLSALDEKRSGRPLQYILGEWEFYGKKVFCGEGCLIPRPETEILTEYALRHLPPNGRFLDLCTGSGCIPTAVLTERKDLFGVGADISESAMQYAQKNRDRYSLSERLELVLADLHTYEPKGVFSAILSNPPYIRSADMEKLSHEVRREPPVALDGGEDGLHFYRVICKRYKRYLAPNGFFAFEAGEDTAMHVAEILESEGFCSETIPDYSGIMRVVTGKRKESV